MFRLRVCRLTLVVLCALAIAEGLNTLDESVEQIIYGANGSSSDAIFRVPGSTSEIILNRRGIHLFLAEYERTLILREGDEELLRLTAAVDTGGMSRMDVYRVSRSGFYLEGTHTSDRYLLDTSKPSVERHVFGGEPAEAQFVGAFDSDERGWRFIPALRPRRENR